jgi:integrase
VVLRRRGRRCSSAVAQKELVAATREAARAFHVDPKRRQILLHNLRGTFLTLALANGKSESWISHRTGHRSSAMLNNYKRVICPMARTFRRTRRGEASCDSATERPAFWTA